MLTEMITTLGPNDPDDGDGGRQRRGIAIAAITKIDSLVKTRFEEVPAI